MNKSLKDMKQLFISILALVLGIATQVHAQDTDISKIENVVYMQPATYAAGTQQTLSIRMKNTVGIQTVQFDVELPDGITVVLDEDDFEMINLSTERTTAKKMDSFSSNKVGTNTYRVLINSSKGYTFDGEDGEIAQLVVTIDPSLANTTPSVVFKGIVLVDTGSHGFETERVECTLTIEGTGDARTILSETSTKMPTAASNVDVQLNRKIIANEWSTICLPFTATGEQVKAAFGSDVKLAAFTSWKSEKDADDAIVAIEVNFESVDAAEGIEANTPMLIRVSKNVETATFDGVTLEPEDEPNVRVGTTSSKRGWFYGTYVPKTVPEENLFISGNKFYYSTGNTTTKGYRGYFELRDVLDSYYEIANVKFSFYLDGTTTQVNDILLPATESNQIYSIDGKYMGRESENLTKGIYIVGGKKVLKH